MTGTRIDFEMPDDPRKGIIPWATRRARRTSLRRRDRRVKKRHPQQNASRTSSNAEPRRFGPTIASSIPRRARERALRVC